MLEKGGRRRADMFIFAAGCRYNLQPSFLNELGVGESLHVLVHCLRPLLLLPLTGCERRVSHSYICTAGWSQSVTCTALSACLPPPAGFHTLYSHCFMGPNPRIGTASDFVFGEGKPAVARQTS